MDDDANEAKLQAVTDITPVESLEVTAAAQELQQVANESGIDLDHPDTAKDGKYRRTDGAPPDAESVMRTSAAEDRLAEARRLIAEQPEPDDLDSAA